MSRPKPSGRSEAEIRRLMQEAATRALDRAHLKVSSGAFDYKSAVKSAVDSLADTMKYVTYPTGHTDTLEVAARRAEGSREGSVGGKKQFQALISRCVQRCYSSDKRVCTKYSFCQTFRND